MTEPANDPRSRAPASTPRRRGVVVACRRSDGRWLMVRRSRHVKRAPLKVGFPGGEIHDGESLEAAAIREMREELGVAIRPTGCIWQYDLPDRPWRLWGLTAELLEDELTPDPAEVDQVLWLTAEQGAAHPDGLPTNPIIFARLLECEADPRPEDERRK